MLEGICASSHSPAQSKKPASRLDPTMRMFRSYNMLSSLPEDGATDIALSGKLGEWTESWRK